MATCTRLIMMMVTVVIMVIMWMVIEDDAEHGKDERVQMKMTITGVLVMMTIVMVRMKMGGWTHLNRSQANLPRQPMLN